MKGYERSGKTMKDQSRPGCAANACAADRMNVGIGIEEGNEREEKLKGFTTP